MVQPDNILPVMRPLRGDERAEANICAQNGRAVARADVQISIKNDLSETQKDMGGGGAARALGHLPLLPQK